MTSSSPLGAASNWAAPVSIDGANSLTSIACPSASLCVAVDDGGNVVSSTDPVGGAAHWSASSVDGSPLLAVACPTTTACVATDGDGGDVTSTNPAGGAAAWTTPRNIEAATDVAITAVSCPAISLCFAVSDSGDVSWSNDPLDASPSWQGPYNIAGTHVITGMSCPTISLCVASSDSGGEITSVGTTASPAALSSGWAPRPMAPREA